MRTNGKRSLLARSQGVAIYRSSCIFKSSGKVGRWSLVVSLNGRVLVSRDFIGDVFPVFADQSGLILIGELIALGIIAINSNVLPVNLLYLELNRSGIVTGVLVTGKRSAVFLNYCARTSRSGSKSGVPLFLELKRTFLDWNLITNKLIYAFKRIFSVQVPFEISSRPTRDIVFISIAF